MTFLTDCGLKFTLYFPDHILPNKHKNSDFFLNLSNYKNISNSSKYRSCEIQTAATKISNLTEKIKINVCVGANSQSKGKSTLLSSHDLFPPKNEISPDYLAKYHNVLHSTSLWVFFHLK